jgi:hypothetical protein
MLKYLYKFAPARIISPKATIEVQKAEEVWRVQWKARNGAYSNDYEVVAAFFPTLEDAQDFHASLVAAKQLLKYTERIGLTIEKL